MKTPANTIEINGKRYDARTGKPIETDAKTPSVTSQPQPKPRGGFVDGFSSRAQAPKATKITINSRPTVTSPAQSQLIAKAPASPTNSQRNHNPVRHKPQRSLTLHRSSVSHPKQPSPATPITAVPAAATPKLTKKTDTARFERSKSIAKSQIIQKFNLAAAQRQLQTNQRHVAPMRPAIVRPVAAAIPSESNKERKERLIKQSLAAAIPPVASERRTPKLQPKHGRILRLASSGIVVLLLAGYVAYLNVPQISMKLAARRAGFAANLPGYQPAGYSLKGPISYNPGQVTINFASNTDDRHFSLKQQPTSWDSEALKENFVAKLTDTEPMIYTDRGLTIYIFNGNDAAWVNAGKLYHLQSANSQLDTDQVLTLATSG